MKKLLPTRYSLLTNSTGLSQVEIMITIVITSIVILGIITTFSTIGRGLITGKTRTIANNLAQEKIEILKNVSYARLLTTSESDLITYGYDNTNTDYTPETLNVGDANYTRYTTVWKAQESGTTISTMSPTATDQGMKKIKIEIKWTEGTETKSLVLYNLRDDPNRSTMSGKIYGIITTTNSVGISAARVEIIQDINRNDTTSTTGYYLIKTTSPATLQINVSKDGYWSKTSVNTAVPSAGSVAINLSLTAKEKGNAYGFVYKRDHLVISEICISTGTGTALQNDTTEYVELYNPTTYTITVSGNYKLKYVDNLNFSFTPVTFAVDSHKYFLIASQSSVNGVKADATYPAAKMPVASNTGGVGLLTTADVWVDSVAWGPAGAIPEGAKEGGSGFIVTAFNEGDSIERISYSTFTTGGEMWNNLNGNAYDSNQSSVNWVWHDNFVNPQNASNSEIPVLGTPVGRAVVSANDGLSSAVSASSTGYYYLTGIATGTVTLYGSSLTLSGVEPNTLITTGGKTNRDIILSSASEGGFISGYVKGPTLGVANITVSAGGYTATTSASPSGYYSFSVDVGSYTVIANPDYTSVPDGANWTSGTSEAEANKTVEVNYGGSVSVGDLIIRPAGWISGTTYNATGGNLPYITIRATSPVASFSKDVVSGTNGAYIMKGMRTANDYDLYPVLDDSDTYSRTGAWGTWTVPVTVATGLETSGRNFKISSAWGKITGTVSDTAVGGRIKTGVLIIATTAAMPADSPPTISGGSVGGTSTIYYGTISDSSGNYSVFVRKGWTYNLKAWYTKLSGATVAVQSTKTGTVNYGVNDSSATVSFSWP